MTTATLREMRVYNLAPFWDPETRTENTWKRWAAILNYGWGWYKEYKAQAQFLETLRPLLDRRFIAIRHYVWPEVIEYPFPIILLGPPGVYLLYVTPLSGEFRIHENRLLELGKGKGVPVKPNLVQRTRLLGAVLEKFIAERLGLEIPVETRLVFTAPDVYVDTVDAEVKPLLPDGVKGFAESLLKSRERLARPEIRRLAELFLESASGQGRKEARHAREQRTAILASAQAQVRGSGEAAPPAARRRRKTQDRIAGLTLKQWLILAGLLALNILLVLVFLFLVASSG
ncbi:MAG: hypothetical protein GXO37_05310 [Chloroflexi bacterium]|nr:hypothetical protein [Chloroflexota bacterium]